MAASGPCSLQAFRHRPTFPGSIGKKRVGGGFAEALAAYLDGAAAVCKIEPQFVEFFPDKIAGPDSQPDEQQRARDYIASLADLHCEKIQADPAACHACEFNPQNGEDRQERSRLIRIYSPELFHVERLHDAARLGLIRLEDLSEPEFDRVRMFYHAIERRKAH